MGRRLLIVYLIALLLVIGREYEADSAESKPLSLGLISLDPARVVWSSLHYEASMLFLTGTSVVRWAYEEPSPEEAKLTIDSAFVGRRSEVQVWFHTADASAKQRHKQRHGRSAYSKTYDFQEQGVSSHRRSPQEQEDPLEDPTSWSRTEDAFYPYGELSRGCPEVSDPSLLFYLLSAADWKTLEEKRQFCFFSDKNLHLVEISVGGYESVPVDFEQASAATTQQQQTTLQTRKVMLRPAKVEKMGQTILSCWGYKVKSSCFWIPKIAFPFWFAVAFRV